MDSARDRNVGIWIEPSDRLYVAAYSSVASLVVRFSGYFRRANGEMTEYAVDVNPTSDRAVTASDVFFGSGFLLSCVAHLASGNASRGQCYVRAQIQRGTGTAAVKLHTVVAGYTTDEYSPSFPYGKQEGPLDGPGYLYTVIPAAIAAGSELNYDVPARVRWKVTYVSWRVVTDANVANREIILEMTRPDDIILRRVGGPHQPAGQTVRYFWADYGVDATNADSTQFYRSIPEVMLPATSVIYGLSANYQAGDVTSQVRIGVEEWIEI